MQKFKFNFFFSFSMFSGRDGGRTQWNINPTIFRKRLILAPGFWKKKVINEMQIWIKFSDVFLYES